VRFEGGSGGEESAYSLGKGRGRFHKNLTRRNRNRGSRGWALRLRTLLSFSRGCGSLSIGGGGLGGHGGGGTPVGSRWPGVQEGPGGYLPLANSSASQVWGYFLTNASGLPYTVGGEVDMSYLGRSGSAEGEGQTVLAGGGGGAGGALSFHFSWREGLALPVWVGRDPVGGCVA